MHTVTVHKHPSLHLYIIFIFCNEYLMCSKSVCFLVVSVNREKADWEQRELCETRALPEASEKFLLWCWKLPERPLRKACTRDCAMEAFTPFFFFFKFPGFLVSFLSGRCCWENTSHTDHCDLWTNIQTFGPQATLPCFKTATCTKGAIYSEQKSHIGSVNTLT